MLVGSYRLQNSEKLMDGGVRDLWFSHVSAHDCFELGRQAYNNGDYFHTNIWMDQAMKLFHEETEKTIGQSDILEYLAFASYMSGNIRRALKLTNQMLEMEP